MIKCEVCKRKFQGTIRKGHTYTCHFCTGEGLDPNKYYGCPKKTEREINMEDILHDLVFAIEAIIKTSKPSSTSLEKINVHIFKAKLILEEK